MIRRVPMLMPTMANTHNMLKRLEFYFNAFDWQNLTKSKMLILQAFMRIATKDGYSSLTMRSLAKAVDLKPSSIYSHYPDGKDQILSAALRWNIYSFASAVKQGLSECQTPEEYWNSLVSVHITQQITRPENDLWDMLMTTDRLGGILPPDLRGEMVEWMAFCDFMYEAVASDWGHQDTKRKSRLIRVSLDGANSWWNWDGSDENLKGCIDYALKFSHSVLNI